MEQWLGVVLSGTESGGFALWGFPELLWTLVLFLLVVGDLIEISETSIVALSVSPGTVKWSAFLFEEPR